MLTIRMQRTGRTGHAQFRVIVQDSRFSPTGGRVTAFLGSYDPHTKVAVLDKDKATQYLTNGAQPSDRVARLLEKEGVKLPSWVKPEGQKKRSTRNPEKLRRNRPAGAEAPAPAEPAELADASVEEAPASEATEEITTEAAPETEAPASEEASPPEAEPVAEAPAAEEPAAEPEKEA